MATHDLDECEEAASKPEVRKTLSSSRSLREFLRAELIERFGDFTADHRKRLALDLGLSLSHFNGMLTGVSGVSESKARSIAERLKLNSSEIEKLLTLKQVRQAKQKPKTLL